MMQHIFEPADRGKVSEMRSTWIFVPIGLLVGLACFGWSWPSANGEILEQWTRALADTAVGVLTAVGIGALR